MYRSTPDIVKSALMGGVKVVQLREKDRSDQQLYNLALELRWITAEADALLIINDRLDIAMAVQADGVHLGQNDFPVEKAREMAPDLIIGASTHSIEEARSAQEKGASYINIGPVFPTKTKDWTGDFLGLEKLRSIAAEVHIPFTVMGGIKMHHIPELKAEGVKTITLVTAITMADDPESASRKLVEAMK